MNLESGCKAAQSMHCTTLGISIHRNYNNHKVWELCKLFRAYPTDPAGNPLARPSASLLTCFSKRCLNLPPPVHCQFRSSSFLSYVITEAFLFPPPSFSLSPSSTLPPEWTFKSANMITDLCKTLAGSSQKGPSPSIIAWKVSLPTPALTLLSPTSLTELQLQFQIPSS